MTNSDRLEFTRSGGFAGLSLQTSTALSDLDDRERRALEHWLATHESGPPGSPASDRFQYDLTLVQGGHRCQLSAREDEIPRALQPLFARLVARAKRDFGKDR